MTSFLAFRSAARAALVAVLAGAPFACNAIWGIDSATLESDAGARDGSKGDAPVTDGSSKDTLGSDGRLPDSGPSDAPNEATALFDGYCKPGSLPVTLAQDPGDPLQLASDEGGVYWTNFSTGSVGILRFGSAPTMGFVPDGGMNYPQGIAAAGGRVAWVASGIGDIFECSAAGCKARVLASHQGATGFLVANPEAAYWETSSAINTCSLPDCDGGVMAVASATAPEVAGLAIDSTYVYWSDGSSNLYSALLAGGGPVQTAATGESGPNLVAAAKGSLYWGTNGGLRTCVLSNGVCRGAPATLVGDTGVLFELEVDDEHVYFIESSSNELFRVSLDGGAPEGGEPPLYEAPRMGGLSIGQSCVFWSQQGEAGAILAAPK